MTLEGRTVIRIGNKAREIDTTLSREAEQFEAETKSEESMRDTLLTPSARAFLTEPRPPEYTEYSWVFIITLLERVEQEMAEMVGR